jgi:hypothetical protein
VNVLNHNGVLKAVKVCVMILVESTVIGEPPRDVPRP